MARPGAATRHVPARIFASPRAQRRYRRATYRVTWTGGGRGGEGSAASPPVRRPAYERLIPIVMRAA